MIRFNPFLVRASVYCPAACRHGTGGSAGGFNPFLVRASVYCEYNGNDNWRTDPTVGFNPFLVRASVYCGS